MRPFFILGTPRSRTAWLAKFLSTPDRKCEHEPSIRFRSMVDLARYVAKPAAAAADSVLTLRWRAIREHSPEAVIVVVRRPRDQVIRSFLGHGVGGAVLDARLRALDGEIDALVSAGVDMVVDYADLAREETCEFIHVMCHGVMPHPLRWRALAPVHIEADIQAMSRAALANWDGLMAVFPELKEAA